MFRKLIMLCTFATLLAACNGESPLTTAVPAEPNLPVIATPITTELPPTDMTPIMVEPPEQGAPKPINSEYLPQREDGNLTRGAVFIDHSELSLMESDPIQVRLTLQGSLPTPCNQLRVIARPPDEQNQIQVEVYSLIDPDKACVQVLEPFEANIGLGSFPTGYYSVWVNGEMVAEFSV